MYYHEFVAKLAQAQGMTKVAADGVLRALFDPADGIIPDALADGDDVVIQGFGVFYAHHHAARKGRHPKTGAPLEIAARRRAGVRWGLGMRERLAR